MPFDHPRLLNLAEITQDRFLAIDKKRCAVIATFSPVEVHGPHLPMAQDIYEGDAIARSVAMNLAENHPDWTFLFLPNYAIACDTLPQPGSIEFPPRIVIRTAFLALRSFARAGFARLILSSFHGGLRHVLALETAAHRLQRRFAVPTVSLFSAMLAEAAEGKLFYDAIKDEEGHPLTADQMAMDQHAGFVETSLGLHLWPELVEDSYKDLPPQEASLEDDDARSTSPTFEKAEAGLPAQVRQWRRMSAKILATIGHYKSYTYHGSPSPSSAEWGKLIFDRLTKETTTLAEEFLEKGLDFDGHSPLWPFRQVLLNEVLQAAYYETMVVDRDDQREMRKRRRARRRGEPVEALDDE